MEGMVEFGYTARKAACGSYCFPNRVCQLAGKRTGANGQYWIRRAYPYRIRVSLLAS